MIIRIYSIGAACDLYDVFVCISCVISINLYDYNKCIIAWRNPFLTVTFQSGVIAWQPRSNIKKKTRSNIKKKT